MTFGNSTSETHSLISSKISRLVPSGHVIFFSQSPFVITYFTPVFSWISFLLSFGWLQLTGKYKFPDIRIPNAATICSYPRGRVIATGSFWIPSATRCSATACACSFNSRYVIVFPYPVSSKAIFCGSSSARFRNAVCKH